MLGEVPELVDFLFLDGAPDDPESWQKAIAGDAEAGRILTEALGGLRDLRMGRRRAARGHAGDRRGCGAQAGQGPGADPGGRHGADAGAPALRLPGRARPGRDATPRWPSPSIGWPPTADALRADSLGPARRRARARRGHPLLRGDAGAGVADLAPVRPARGGRCPGHGSGAVRRGAVARSGLPARRGAAPLPPGVLAPDHGDGEQGAGRRLHGGRVGGDVPGEQGRAPRRHPRGGRATTATRTWPTPRPRSRRAMRRWC